MSFTPSKLKSKIYYRFSEISRTKYRDIIRFYEDNAPHIDELDFEEYFELHLIYVFSLFEVGSYEEFLRKVDDAIYTVISENIMLFEGGDVYVKLLTKKASALYNLRKYDPAIHICQELIKMERSSLLPPLLLKKCLLKKSPGYVGTLRAVCIFSLMVASVCFASELFIVEAWNPELKPFVVLVRNASFLIGIISLIASHMAPQLISTFQVERLLRKDSK